METPRRTVGRMRSQGKRAAVAGLFGTALEYYDMQIYASASALVFGRIFFPNSGPTALLFAFATYGVAYLARPLGGILAGHFGDRFGRRNVMVATILVMGISTFLIGCLPSYAAIGLAAPMILVILRLMQGLSVGGELSGSTGLTIEHAPEGRRGFYSMWALNGAVGGQFLATLVFIWVAALPDEILLSWGWRVPFWVSAVIVVVGVFIRRTVRDPDEFVNQKREGAIVKIPIREVFRFQSVDVLRVAFCSLLIVISVVVPVYGLAYATDTHHIRADVMLGALLTAYAATLVTQPLFAWLSDRIGRKPVLIGGNLLGAVVVWQYFWAISEHNIPMIYLGLIVCFAIAYAATQAVYPVFFAEMFSTKIRVSGMAIGLQIGLIISGFSPAVITFLASETGDAWWPAATVTSVAAVLAIIATSTARETHRVPLSELGR